MFFWDPEVIKGDWAFFGSIWGERFCTEGVGRDPRQNWHVSARGTPWSCAGFPVKLGRPLTGTWKHLNQGFKYFDSLSYSKEGKTSSEMLPRVPRSSKSPSLSTIP